MSVCLNVMKESWLYPAGNVGVYIQRSSSVVSLCHKTGVSAFLSIVRLSVKIVSVLTLSGMIFVSEVSAGCHFPDSLAGANMLAENTQTYSPDNPMANDVYNIHFDKDNRFTYRILSDNTRHEGTFSYVKLAPDVAVISTVESFNGERVNYDMKLICNNDYSGTYIYQQREGVGNERTNTARYFFLNDTPNSQK
ncbi:hypothetical protein [Citrobacter koseri]|uniref:hypothetical protein n=1 Tax=Citrobacter koseri TaxID=545 RepID=UPI001F1AB46D|nr:hypothetical protein [Citrobacter koseri]